MIVIRTMRVMRDTKKYFHLTLVVGMMRMSMMQMEIFAKASADGVKLNAIQIIVIAFET